MPASTAPGRRICEVCKQEVAETDGKERTHYSAAAGILAGMAVGKQVFVCNTCGAKWSPAFKVFMLIMGVIFALIFGMVILMMMFGPDKKKRTDTKMAPSYLCLRLERDLAEPRAAADGGRDAGSS
jgi:hypothetical protein